MEAPLPRFEEARLAVLYAYEVLDTESEPYYDAVVRCAARQFHCPYGVLSLLDRDREWYKARIGFERSETPRDEAFAPHAINCDEPFVVHDATQDPRFADNELVAGPPRLRFIVAAPLMTPSGVTLGALMAFDKVDHEATPEMLSTFGLLADSATRSLELRRVSRQLIDLHMKQTRFVEVMQGLLGSSEAA